MLVKHPIQNTSKVLEHRYLFTFRTIKNYLIHVKLGKTIRCFSPKMNMFRFHRCCHLKLFYSNACRIYVDIMTGERDGERWREMERWRKGEKWGRKIRRIKRNGLITDTPYRHVYLEFLIYCQISQIKHILNIRVKH